MRLAYADPPYPGCAHLYAGHPDFGGEVDHADLVARLEADFDGWVLHTSTGGLRVVVPLLPQAARIMSWVKPFAAFKRNVSVAYAWEPVIVRAVRKPVVDGLIVMRDWVSCPMTMERGLTGAKPEKVCHWAFEMAGARPDDDLVDMFPGTGAVAQAWTSWRKQVRIPRPQPTASEDVAGLFGPTRRAKVKR